MPPPTIQRPVTPDVPHERRREPTAYEEDRAARIQPPPSRGQEGHSIYRDRGGSPGVRRMFSKDRDNHTTGGGAATPKAGRIAGWFMKRVPQWMQGSNQQGAPASMYQGAPVNHIHPNHPFSQQVGPLANWFMDRVPANPVQSFFSQPGELALFFMRQTPQWVQDADRRMMPAPPPPRAPVTPADPLVHMKEIDRLQNIVSNLKTQRDAGRPAPDEENQISYARNGLQAHIRMCRERRSFNGAPIAKEHVGFLTSYAQNALDDVKSMESSMGHNPTGKTPLDALPAHVDLLEPREKESFGESFAILNSILQDKNRPLSPESAATLKNAASTLERLNKLCEHNLAAHVSDSEPDNPASLLSMYDNIDQFQSALDRAVREAIGNEAPVSRARVSDDGLTDGESYEQSLNEIRRLLGEGQARRLSPDEDDVINRHFDNLGARLETFDPDQKATAREEKEAIRTAIENYKASREMGHVPESMPEVLPPLESSSSLQNPRRVMPKEESEEENIYTATPRLSPRPLEDTRTRNFGRGSASGRQSFAPPPIQEMRDLDPHAPPVTRGGFSGFSSGLKHSHPLNISPFSNDDGSIQPSRSLRRSAKFGQSTFRATDTASLLSEPVRQDAPPLGPVRPGGTSNTARLPTRRVAAQPSTSDQRIEEADKELEEFSLLRPPAMLEPLPTLTSFQTRTGASVVNGPVNNDLRRMDSILSQPVRNDLQTLSREWEPVQHGPMLENPSLYSSPQLTAQPTHWQDDDAVSDFDPTNWGDDVAPALPKARSSGTNDQ